MNRICFILLTFFFLNHLSAQSLSEQLWQKVENCWSHFEDMDEDGKVDYDELIDDARNGYLKVAGEWPTCGCGCENVVGAFKDMSGQYTLLEKENWNCSWQHHILSNRDLDVVFPTKLLESYLWKSAETAINGQAAFYLDIEVPRYGTDMNIAFKLIPLGIVATTERPIAFSYQEEGTRQSYHTLRDLATSLEDPTALDHFVNKDYGKLSAEDQSEFDNLLGDGFGEFKDLEILHRHLSYLEKVHAQYQKLNYTSLVLGWNKKAGSFYVKENGERPPVMDFATFLQEMRYWMVVC
ncbi:MAG: hypothetical protein AAF206_05920 [Bacteroidota bacterium]